MKMWKFFQSPTNWPHTNVRYKKMSEEGLTENKQQANFSQTHRLSDLVALLGDDTNVQQYLDSVANSVSTLAA